MDIKLPELPDGYEWLNILSNLNHIAVRGDLFWDLRGKDYYRDEIYGLAGMRLETINCDLYAIKTNKLSPYFPDRAQKNEYPKGF